MNKRKGRGIKKEERKEWKKVNESERKLKWKFFEKQERIHTLKEKRIAETKKTDKKERT